MVKVNLSRAAIVSVLMFLSASLSYSATSKTYIEKLSGWESCSSCAGKGGTGVNIPYSMTRYVVSPTMGAKSARFSVGGTKPYGAAIWWKQLGASSASHNFTYEANYYLKNPSASQALEFDVNQSVNGKKLIFGTQCNIAMHTYDVWSAATHWVHTGISCARPAAYKWNHIVLEFQRTSANNVKFVSVSINGVKHYINRTYAPISSSVHELNVAFQMDGNKTMTDYNAYLENVKLTYW